MKVSLFSGYGVSNYGGNVPKSPSFKSDIVIDLGGSVIQTSLKELTSDDNGNIIYSNEGILNDEHKSCYEDAMDFKKRVHDCFKNQAILADNYSWEIYNKPDKVKGIALFVPTYTYQNRLLFLPNLKDKNGKALRDIDFSDMVENLKKDGINFVDKPNVKILQDATGSGLAIGKKLYEEGLLTPGKKFIVALTGGGCGISTVECIDEGIAIVSSSGSAISISPDEVKKISSLGGSAKTFTANFCNKLGIKDVKLIDKIVSCGKAIFTAAPSYSPDSSKFDFRDKKLFEYLTESGKYEMVDDCIGNSYVKLTEEAMPYYKKAWNYAVNKYAKALSVLENIGIIRNYDGLIITGPFAHGLQMQNAQLPERINEFADEAIAWNEEAQFYKKVKGFKVKVSDQYLVKNNTPGAEIALSPYTQYINPKDSGAGLKVNYAKICEEAKKLASVKNAKSVFKAMA